MVNNESQPSESFDSIPMTPEPLKDAGAPPSQPPQGEPELEMGGEEASNPWRPELQGMGLDGGGEEEGLPVETAATGLKAQLTRANLFFFGIFLIGVGLVAFMSMRGGPDKTTAAEQEEQKEVDSAIKKFLARQEAVQKTEAGQAARGKTAKADPSEASRSPEALMKDTRGLVDMFYNFTEKNQVPVEDLKANPFDFQMNDGEAAAKAAKEKKEAEEAARAKRLAAARADLKKLSLQSILSGPSGRQAMVNSSVVRKGSTIENFTVEEIQQRRVILSRDGETYKLEMEY